MNKTYMKTLSYRHHSVVLIDVRVPILELRDQIRNGSLGLCAVELVMSRYHLRGKGVDITAEVPHGLQKL